MRTRKNGLWLLAYFLLGLSLWFTYGATEVSATRAPAPGPPSPRASARAASLQSCDGELYCLYAGEVDYETDFDIFVYYCYSCDHWYLYTFGYAPGQFYDFVYVDCCCC
jgi:hypothetical protein